jgi:hypothetical protein
MRKLGQVTSWLAKFLCDARLRVDKNADQSQNQRNLAWHEKDIHSSSVRRLPPLWVLLAGLYILALLGSTIYFLSFSK